MEPQRLRGATGHKSYISENFKIELNIITGTRTSMGSQVIRGEGEARVEDRHTASIPGHRVSQWTCPPQTLASGQIRSVTQLHILNMLSELMCPEADQRMLLSSSEQHLCVSIRWSLQLLGHNSVAAFDVCDPSMCISLNGAL